MASVHRKRWIAVAGWTVTAAAAGIGYLVLTAAPAAAQPVSIPGVGLIEVPNGISIPSENPGVELPGRTEVPEFEFAPLIGIPEDQAQILIRIPWGESPTAPGILDVSGPNVVPGVVLPLPSGLPDPVQSLLDAIPGADFVIQDEPSRQQAASALTGRAANHW
ncbi:hypothetical protein ACLMAJ_02205 [Nocardia sp. KC 131]|uniref:hypothetical protein n=1 Tax=Nocardia arseniciresistens TaxID=3392119 RepID=UPI00398E9B93